MKMVVVHKLIFCALILSASIVPLSAQAVETWIYGLPGWFAVGDTIQFVGDLGTTQLYNGACDAWAEGCRIDWGFGFRRVFEANESTCTWESASATVYVCFVPCCFWMGACESNACGECDDLDDCGNNCYCMSLWRILSFQSVPGDRPTGGCYRIELVCNPDASCIGRPPGPTVVTPCDP